RQTITELVADNFYGTLAELAHEHGCRFSTENVAPTMMSDGMLHFREVDLPMGEFWLRSPTHDKPNDMLDAISASRIYGKPIVQAEAFTQLRMAWDEHPGRLKALGDRHYALGVNRFVYHVFAHNPWLDRRPGMTLDGVGLYFQRDQTWWQPGRAWVEYAHRVQALLQTGEPVVDVAIFTGEELPRRAVRPERLIDMLPNVMDADVVAAERRRRQNTGQPMRELPAGVRASAHLTDLSAWPDPLRGYGYDSINPDALLRLARPQDGRLTLPGGAIYRVLVLPKETTPGFPSAPRSPAVAAQVGRLREAGVAVIDESFAGATFAEFGIAPDLLAVDRSGGRAGGLAWTHRRGDDFDLYFVSNQQDDARTLELSLRVAGRTPELWNPVTGEIAVANGWSVQGDRTVVPITFAPAQAWFVIFRERAATATEPRLIEENLEVVAEMRGPWRVSFDPHLGGPPESARWSELIDWSRASDLAVRHYSGTATYEATWTWQEGEPTPRRVWLDVGQVHDLAEVWVNGVNCGVAWTAPHRVEITAAVRSGTNELRIAVTNTWRNRLIGDASLPADERVTWTTAPDRWSQEPLLPAGLLGPVRLLSAPAPKSLSQ
ncbi:MAG TPA: glycosyl hydrolase, partial [Candidatus Synoicihabitans sp.]|nr:glycosyl hydrolase [Candidatus Synoicihabitans sp.]